LVILVLVAVVPLLVLGVGAAWRLVEQRRAEVEFELTSTARALQLAVARDLTVQLASMGSPPRAPTAPRARTWPT
jgi:hypothetical protein